MHQIESTGVKKRREIVTDPRSCRTNLVVEKLTESAQQGGQEGAVPADHFHEEGRPGPLPAGNTKSVLWHDCEDEREGA